MSDFSLFSEGRFSTVYLLYPVSPAAKQWVRDNIGQDATFFGPSVAIEHRYVGDVIDGIVGDDLTVTIH